MGKTSTAVATLVGTIIGAGILGLPYVVMRAGFLVGILNMILIAAVMIIIYLYLGEIALRTKKNLHLAGYAEKYLGKKGKIIMFTALALGVYASLIAYLIGEGESLSFLFFNNANFSLHFGLAFWAFLSLLTFYGIESLKRGEKTGVAAIIVLIVLMVVLFWNQIDVSNLTYNNFSLFYIPFGVAIFAFLGFASIPEVKRILKGNKRLMRKSILIAIPLTLLIYVLFIAIVLGSQGTNTPELATLALGKIFVLLGMLTMATSYLAISTALIDSLRYDFKKTKKKAWFYTISAPLIIFILLNMFDFASFIKILGIGGVISGGITGTLILLMARKAKLNGDRKPEYETPYSKILTGIIILFLLAGTLLELFI